MAQFNAENYLGIFLYGSQNYGLDYEGSDLDMIAIVLAAPRPRYNVTTPTGKMKVYTLKYFLHRLQLGDLECYEILYTPYHLVNPTYSTAWKAFVEDISNTICYSRIQYSLLKKLDEHINHILWMPSAKDGAKYNRKRLYWALRVCNQLERIERGESFESSLAYQDLYGWDIMQIKTQTNYLSVKELNTIYKHLVRTLRASRHCVKEPTEEERQVFSNFYNLIFNNKETSV